MLEFTGVGFFSLFRRGISVFFSIFKPACSFYCFSSMPTNHEL
uniref:Uncharacterized protein n=1 Tax=Anguilla anguilla TaxID=7936 RepID=A0A0E9R1S5_ANGAN